MSKATSMGQLPLHKDKVYCVDKVVLLPLSQAPLPEELRSHKVLKYQETRCVYCLCRVMNR